MTTSALTHGVAHAVPLATDVPFWPTVNTFVAEVARELWWVPVGFLVAWFLRAYRLSDRARDRGVLSAIRLMLSNARYAARRAWPVLVGAFMFAWVTLSGAGALPLPFFHFDPIASAIAAMGIASLGAALDYAWATPDNAVFIGIGTAAVVAAARGIRMFDDDDDSNERERESDDSGSWWKPD